ncbi:MAG: S8 family serine peptidase [Candidatus Eisenbacteria bacterium]|nr:S8 family serine peptidase [Candidatus Eisenbacteria bacterium]
MRLRSILFLTFAALLVQPVSSQAQVRKLSDLEPGLRAVAEGGEIPLANRPLPAPVATLGLKGPRVTPDYVRPTEFGVLFEFDGSRSELEASGIRVNTQVGHLFTARVRPDEVRNLMLVSGLRNARLERYMEPHLNAAMTDTRGDLEHGTPSGSPPVYPGHTGRNVIIGDVDSGIDFNKPDFQDPVTGKTRILYIWDQTDLVGPNPSTFTYGSEWTKNDIDNTPGSIRQMDLDGHGTNVCGTAAGNGSETGCSQPGYRYVGMAPEASIIQVKTNFTDTGIIDGVNYVFQKAAALGRPAVCNLSLGGHSGPHDGSDAFSTGVGALSGVNKIIVASAGNSNNSKIHGKLTTTSNTVGVDKFTVSVPAYTARGGTFNDYILIAGWYDPTVSLTIRVKGPAATDTVSVGLGQMKESNTVDGKIFVVNQVANQGFGGTSRDRQFEIQLYDSLAARPPKNGTWEIDVVTNTGSPLASRVDIWMYVYSLGSLGAAPQVVTGLDNSTLVGGPGDADSVFTVAAHTTKPSWFSCAQGGTCAYTSSPPMNAIASFSSNGPRRDGVLKPEISAPGFGIATTHSDQSGAIGVCGDVDDGVHEINQGTSFSSPLVAGAVALFLEYRTGVTPSLIKASFEPHTRRDGFTGAVPNSIWGWGKLDVFASLDHTPPVVNVTSPVGGENWVGGSSHNITWTAVDSIQVDTVKIEVSEDGGGSWTTLAHGVANTGSQPWTVPVTAHGQVRARVTAWDTAKNFAADISDSNAHIVDVEAGGSAAFALGRSRPNPTPGRASIRFILPAAGPVDLAVFDLAGRRVATLAQGRMSAGAHEATWDGRGAASGVYFYRLRAGSQSAERRLVLVH